MARKKEVEVPTREELVALVGELNNVLGLDPQFKVTKKMADEDIIEKIKEIATDNVYESDFEALNEDDVEGEHFYSEDSQRVFAMLKIEIAAGSPPNPEEVAEEVEEVEEAPVKGKKEKAAPAEKPAKEKKEKAPAKEKRKTATRTDCFCEAVLAIGKKGKTISDISEDIDAAYVKAGGDSNLKQTEHMVRVHLPVLVGVGFVEVKDKTIFLIQ